MSTPVASNEAVEAACPLAPETRERYGRRAFEAYNVAVGGRTWDGKPIPGWDAITDNIREAWRTAAHVAVYEAWLDEERE